VEYVGEIINKEMRDARLLENGDKEANYYLMQVTPNQHIDELHKGNHSRFINSSCHLNCETQKWTDGSSGEVRVGIFGIKNIAAKEEVSYDYNFKHYGGEGSTSFWCKCGAQSCRGTLDAKHAPASLAPLIDIRQK
jgi:SET domain-containing protein